MTSGPLPPLRRQRRALRSIYEIVWFQLLELVIGSSSVSIGVLLGTFMGGMCLGSLLLPRIVPPRRHPLRVYAALEARHRHLRSGCCCCHADRSAGCTRRGAARASPAFCCAGWSPASVCCRRRWRWVRRCRRWRAGSRRRRRASRGWDSSTRATSPGRSADRCWRASICCASTTWRFATYVAGGDECGGRGPRGRPGVDARSPCRERRGSPVRTGLDSPERVDVNRSPIARAAAVYVAIALSGFCALAGEVIWTRRSGSCSARPSTPFR